MDAATIWFSPWGRDAIYIFGIALPRLSGAASVASGILSDRNEVDRLSTRAPRETVAKHHEAQIVDASDLLERPCAAAAKLNVGMLQPIRSDSDPVLN